MKNNKLLAIFLSVLLVSACSKTLTQGHLADAIKFCDDKGGIYEINIYDGNEKFVNCKNGVNSKINSAN